MTKNLIAFIVFVTFMPLFLRAQTLYNSDGSMFVPKSYYPNFSWDKTPQYNMFGDGNLLSDSERAFINSNTDFICIEKSHGGSELGFAELGAKYEATKFHELDSSNKVLFYFNSSWAWPFTSYCQYFTAEHIDDYPILKSYLVIDQATGELFDRNGTYGWNVLNPALRTWWVETVATGVEDAGCDGVFIDQSSGLYWYHEGGEAVVDPAMGEMMANLRSRLPNKFIIGNGHHKKDHLWPSCDATMFEHYKLDLLSKEELLVTWADMAKIAKDNKASIFRVGVNLEAGSEVDDMSRAEKTAYMKQLSKDRLEYYHAVFLIGAQPYSYLQYGWGFQLYDGGALVDYPEFSKPLGAPLGAYKRNGWEFTRVFENASVWVNTDTKTASIKWIENPVDENKAIANLALAGTATQSSTLHGGVASRAIDGTTNGAFGAGSVTHTSPEYKPWWQVDLGANYRIDEITVYNRTDASAIARLSDFTVYVLDEDSAVVDSTIYTTYPDPSVTTDAGGVEGRFVKVQLNGNGALNLAEVTVAESKILVEKKKISINLFDDATNDSITLASLFMNDLTYTSNFVGEFKIELPAGEYPFSLRKKGYHTLNQTLSVTKDTVIALQMAKERFNLHFQVKDAATNDNIPSVLISINDSIYETDALGSHSLVLDYGDYDFILSKDNYFVDSGSVSLSMDTTLTLHMSVETGVYSHFKNEIKIYPNPINDVLSIDLNKGSMAKFEVLSISGKTLLSGNVTEGKKTIELGGLLPGIYLVKILVKEEVATAKIIKN